MENQKSRWRLTTITLVFAGCLSAAKANIIEGTVSKNVDGDTLWVEVDDMKSPEDKPEILKIRMLGVDAPESCLPNPDGQCVGQGHFGEDAKVKLAELSPVGAKVRVDVQGKDVYQRTLGRIFDKNVDIDLKLIQLGVATPYIICAGERCDKTFLQTERVKDYLAACKSARAKGLGVWNPKDPLPEMPFEFRLRIAGKQHSRYVGSFQTRQLYEPADYKNVGVCDRVFFPNINAAEAAGFELY